MSDIHAPFWVALMNHHGDREQRARLWNGYLGWKLPPRLRGEVPQSGWPQLVVTAPPGGWPDLSEEDKSLMDDLAAANGGHPSWDDRHYMDFSGNTFESAVDLSDCTLVDANFSDTCFKAEVHLEATRFFAQSWFRATTFESGAYFHRTFFEADADFSQAQFRGYGGFTGVRFNGGATFAGSSFRWNARFDDSKFVETYFSAGAAPLILADFRNAHFPHGASFRNVVFGEDPEHTTKRLRPRRLVDFSDARFQATTDFRQAVFNGVPAFFNCSLHEDANFSGVRWPRARPAPDRIEYAIRAWERLELMMSELEKPLDRHRFYGRKMRTRRLSDGPLLRSLNWLFDVTSDYGWSVPRAAVSWFIHWLVGAILLYANTAQNAVESDALRLFTAALGTAFANAHAFLALGAEGGYLESGRALMQEHNHVGLFAGVGVVQTILGPVFVFLLLLTVRNRFRLA